VLEEAPVGRGPLRPARDRWKGGDQMPGRLAAGGR